MKQRSLLYIITALLALTACIRDDVPTIERVAKELTIRVVMPGQGSQPESGYAMEIESDDPYEAPISYAPAFEKEIVFINVLAFKASAQIPSGSNIKEGEYLYHIMGVLSADKSSFRIQPRESSYKQSFVIVVNAATEVYQALRTIGAGESKQSVINKMIIQREQKWDVITMNQTGIPMWAETDDMEIDWEDMPTGISVKMARMLAKINILNETTNFELNSAYIYNPKKKGVLMPNNWDTTNLLVEKPTIPSASSTDTGVNYSYTTTTNKFEDLIYTFETGNVIEAITDPLKQTCMVVGGKLDGGATTYYYRVNLVNGTTAYDVLRNHTYQIKIKKVETKGATTPDDAYKGISTVDADVEEWNDMNGDMWFGNKHLKVSQRYPWTLLDGSTEVYAGSNRVKISSTESDGWKFNSSDAVTKATLEWAKPSVQSGAQNVETIVTFHPDPTALGREGEIKIVSGNLTYKIYYIQDDCGRRGIPLKATIGTNEYLIHRYGTNNDCWMVENSKEGLANDLNGYGGEGTIIAGNGTAQPKGANGRYYSWHNATVMAPDVDAPCPEGWALPVSTNSNKLREAINANVNALSARWWTGVKGVDNRAFAGEYNSHPLVNNKYTWSGWNTRGRWWSLGGFSHSLYSSTALFAYSMDGFTIPFWGSVRCVRTKVNASKTHFTLKQDGTPHSVGDDTFTVISSNPEGWRIISLPDWVNSSLSNGPSGVVSSVVITADATATPRKGLFYIVLDNNPSEIITFSITQDDCGIEGKAQKQTIGANQYLTHRYAGNCWMVENSKEGVSTAQMYKNNPAQVNGYYYTWQQATSTEVGVAPCPFGWILPTEDQFRSVMPEANIDMYFYGRWWTGPVGAADNAYAGYYLSSWSQWGTASAWWNSSTPYGYAHGYYDDHLNAGGVASAGDYVSVRCIQDKLSVESKTLDFMLDATPNRVGDDKFKVTTILADGWSITELPSWAKASPMGGVFGVLTTVTVTVDASAVQRRGSLKVTAGTTTKTVSILQSDCGLDDVPKSVVIGANRYQTVMFGSDCWMLENSKEGLASDPNGYGGNGSVAGGGAAQPQFARGAYYHWNQAGNGCPTRWDLPNDAQWEAMRANINAAPVSQKTNFWRSPNQLGGYHVISIAQWRNWNTQGVWWSSSVSGQYYNLLIGSSTGGLPDQIMKASAENGIWANVRCVTTIP